MKLSTALKNLNSDKDIDNFLKDLCTPAEIEAMKERWEVAQLLYKGDSTYRDIASKLNDISKAKGETRTEYWVVSTEIPSLIKKVNDDDIPF